MNTVTRYIALPVLSAGFVCGAALGMAGAASAAGTTSTAGPAHSVSSTADGNFHAPTTRATPAYDMTPGIQARRQFHRVG